MILMAAVLLICALLLKLTIISASVIESVIMPADQMKIAVMMSHIMVAIVSYDFLQRMKLCCTSIKVAIMLIASGILTIDKTTF